MSIEHIVGLLIEERDRLEAAIAALQGPSSAYGNGFGPVPGPYTPGSPVQSGSPSVTPVATIGATAALQSVGLTSAGLFQFNIVVPSSTPNGDNAIVAQTGPFHGLVTQQGTLISVQQ